MNNKELIENGMDIMNSFCIAVQQAGGIYLVNRLKDMTAYELISTLATNNIRFVYGGSKK